MLCLSLERSSNLALLVLTYMQLTVFTFDALRNIKIRVNLIHNSGKGGLNYLNLTKICRYCKFCQLN